MNLTQLIQLMHHRWNIAILAELDRTAGAKFITLVNRLRLSRSSLTRCLDSLIAQGLVRRNSGYGHPMRPEYLLTRRGQALSRDCHALVEVLGKKRQESFAFRKWTLPLIAAIGGRKIRFGELKSALSTVSPRALTLGLKELEQRRWIRREVTEDYPPTTGYRLTQEAMPVWRALEELCATAALPAI